MSSIEGQYRGPTDSMTPLYNGRPVEIVSNDIVRGLIRMCQMAFTLRNEDTIRPIGKRRRRVVTPLRNHHGEIDRIPV